MTADHRLRPDHAPTPFSAARIRDASPSGHTVETATQIGGVVVARQRIAFQDATATSVTMRAVPLDEAGSESGAAHEQRVDWLELQAHASFPESATTIGEETIVTPLGALGCLRYDVAGPDATSTFWFAVDHPGMPVRFTSDAEGAPTTEVVSISGR